MRVMLLLLLVAAIPTNYTPLLNVGDCKHYRSLYTEPMRDYKRRCLVKKGGLWLTRKDYHGNMSSEMLNTRY